MEEDDFEKIAMKIREAMDATASPRLHAIDLVTHLKQTGAITDYYIGLSDLGSADGKYDADKNALYFSHKTWEQAKRGNPRANFTIAHEVAHAILKHDGIRYRDMRLAKFQRRPIKNDETAANQLAAAILAPYDMANYTSAMTSGEISTKFGLSKEAADIRLETYGRIHRARTNTSRTLPPGVIDFLRRQSEKGYRVSAIVQMHVPPKFDGNPCASCGNFTLIRKGVQLVCNTCGTRHGDD